MSWEAAGVLIGLNLASVGWIQFYVTRKLEDFRVHADSAYADKIEFVRMQEQLKGIDSKLDEIVHELKGRR